MNENISQLLNELKEAFSRLRVIRDLYQEDLDYFNEDDRSKINSFNADFDDKYEALERKINTFSRFVEKKFSPTPEQIACKQALEKLHKDFPDFETWGDDVKKALLERELKSSKVKTLDVKEKKPTIGVEVSIDNPMPDKVYYITDDFTFCRPSSIVILGKRFEIVTWRDAMTCVGHTLYGIDKKPLDEFINNDASERPIFFRIKQAYHRRPVEVAEGVYMEANLNAADMMRMCKRLLDIYEISYDNIQIYLRKVAK